MRNYWWILVLIIFLGLIGAGVYWFWGRTSCSGDNCNTNNLLACNRPCSKNEQCETGYCYGGFCRQEKCFSNVDCQCVESNSELVQNSFVENFRDGIVDGWWQWNDGGNKENIYKIDEVYEQLALQSVGGTSQWSNVDTAPMLFFDTDKDFEMEVEFNFDPKVDFTHAGVGIYNKQNKEWVRASRAYDSHSLVNQSDVANTLYFMEKKNNEILKYDHANYVDTKVYLIMKKIGTLISYKYSRDGKQWSDLGKIDRPDMKGVVSLYLFSYTTNANPVTVFVKNIRFDILNQKNV